MELCRTAYHVFESRGNVDHFESFKPFPDYGDLAPPSVLMLPPSSAAYIHADLQWALAMFFY
jgi:hypothetical protein